MTLRPATPQEVANAGRAHTRALNARELLDYARSVHPEATAVGIDWHSEYDDEGGYFPSIDAVLIQTPAGLWRAGWNALEDERGEELPLPAGWDSPEDLCDAFPLGVAELDDLLVCGDGPGELGVTLAALEGTFGEAPPLFIEVAS